MFALRERTDLLNDLGWFGIYRANQLPSILKVKASSEGVASFGVCQTMPEPV